MIKVEVVFDKDKIIVNNCSISIKLDDGFKDEYGKPLTQVLEEAIRYCLQQQTK